MLLPQVPRPFNHPLWLFCIAIFGVGIRENRAVGSMRGRRRFAGCLLLFALVFLPSVAEGKKPDAAPVPFGQGLLWRIEAAGTEPSYVLGTIHITDPRVHDLPAPIESVLGSVDSLTVEVALTPEATAQMAGAILLRDGPALDTMLGPETFGRLSTIAAAYGVPSGILARLAPWGAAMVIAAPPSEHARVRAGAPVFDSMLQLRAEERGIPVHSLETIEEQIAALSSLPQQHQLTMLRQVIDVHDEIDTLFERIVRLYLARDIAGVQAWLVDQSAGEDEDLLAAFLDSLVYTRNLRMVERMGSRLAEGNALIAIGALHLPGDQGVLALLAGQGYAIDRVY